MSRNSRPGTGAGAFAQSVTDWAATVFRGASVFPHQEARDSDARPVAGPVAALSGLTAFRDHPGRRRMPRIELRWMETVGGATVALPIGMFWAIIDMRTTLATLGGG